MSAVWSGSWQLSIDSTFSCTMSHTQCQQIMICLAHLWNWGFSTIAMDPSLSPFMHIGALTLIPSSSYKLLSQHASRPASDNVMVLANQERLDVSSRWFCVSKGQWWGNVEGSMRLLQPKLDRREEGIVHNGRLWLCKIRTNTSLENYYRFWDDTYSSEDTAT